MPDHADLASYHAQLATQLKSFDIVQTTDGVFCMAQTVAKMVRHTKVIHLNSFHTDHVGYARTLTAESLHSWCGKRLGGLLTDHLKIHDRVAAHMQAKLSRRLKTCQHIWVSRDDEYALSRQVLAKEHISRLRRGINKALFYPRPTAQAELRQMLGIADDLPIFAFTGRLDASKNITLLLNALAALKAQAIPFHLVTAGEGPAQAEANQSLGQQVTHYGYIPPARLAETIAGCDMFLWPSAMETFGSAPFEALASAVPVMALDYGQLGAFIRQNQCGLLRANEVEAWISTLTDLTRQPEHLRSYKLAARRAIPRIATWEDVLRQDLLPVWQSFCSVYK